jgi:hypothetical protein
VQHATARSPFIHYSSPRFRREARQDLEQISNEFAMLYSKLIATRRLDAQELHRNVTALWKEMAQKEMLLAETEAVLERYRLQVGELD